MRPHARLLRVSRRPQQARRGLLAIMADVMASANPTTQPASFSTATQPSGTPVQADAGSFTPDGDATGSSSTVLSTTSGAVYGGFSAASSATTTSAPSSSTTDGADLVPSTAESALTTSDDTQFTHIDAQSTFATTQMTVETSTSVIPITSVVSVSGTAATTTVWISSLPSAASSQSQSASSQGTVSTETIVAIAIACVAALVVSVFGYRLWRNRRSACKDARDAEKPVPFGGEYQFSPIEDPFKFRSPESPTSVGYTKRSGTPLPINTTTTTREEIRLDDPATGSSPASSTYSYINSLCPETTALFPEPPSTYPVSHSRPQTPTTPRSFASARTQPGTVGFRPLPMPIQLSPLVAAHFAHPEERASVWSVMEVEDARGTVYDAYAWNGGEVFEIGSPPEYSRE